MTRAFLIAARRTPVMPANGVFARLLAHDLAAPVIAACLADAGIDSSLVDELILSNALGAGGNPARIAALAAGLPERVAGLSIDRQCAGGVDAFRLAAALVQSGAARVVLAGGAESASRRPLRAATDPDGGPPVPYDQARFTPWPDRDPAMHCAAAALAHRLGITRTEQDAFAIASHAAARAGRQPEITPLIGQTQDGFTRHLTPALAARARIIEGTITPANTAVSADAAAFGLVVSEDIARKAPRAILLAATATIGADPTDPGQSPLPALRAVLGITDPGSVTAEIMEAYAVQALACIRAARLDPEKTNRNGGALARGHPIGASGAILVARLFHDLTIGTGVAAIAAAGGIGAALRLEA